MQFRLTVALVLVLLVSLASMAVAVDVSVARVLRDEFDAALLDDAEALANMVEPKAGDVWEFDEGQLPQVRGGSVTYEVRLDDGRVLASQTGPASVSTRRLAIVRTPRGDEVPEVGVATRLITVHVERPTTEIDALLRTIRWVIALSGTAVMLVASLVARITVKRGLDPLNAVSDEVRAIDAGTLEARLEPGQLPSELRPMIVFLNELLSRLEASFVRERRFSGDLSHELRTPLSGLRGLIEVSLSRARDTSSYEQTLRECLDIVVQTSSMVERMLELVRVESSGLHVAQQPVELRPLVERSWSALHAKATARGLSFENRVADGVMIFAEAGLVTLILNNLLSNAVSYTETNGLVAVESRPDDGLLLSVIDSGPHIPAQSVPRLFERLYRVDRARSTSEHLDLGLAIVQQAVERISASVTVVQDTAVRFEVTRPRAS